MDDPLVSHVGIAVADLEQSIVRFSLITGHAPIEIVEVPDQQVKVAMFAPSQAAHGHRSTRIELVAATSQESPIARFIARRGEGIHHLCIYVDNIDQKLVELKSAGVRLIDEIPRIGADNERIAFLHPSSMSGVLVELHERR